eukprot:7512150-Pyramimonas_sp.AAC.1
MSAGGAARRTADGPGRESTGPRGGLPCQLRHWDLRWSSLWGREAREGCVPKWGGAAVRAAPLGP